VSIFPIWQLGMMDVNVWESHFPLSYLEVPFLTRDLLQGTDRTCSSLIPREVRLMSPKSPETDHKPVPGPRRPRAEVDRPGGSIPIQRGHTVRYDANHTIVTDSVIVTAYGRRYRIADLRLVGPAKGPVRREPVIATLCAAVLATASMIVSVARSAPNPILVAVAGSLIVAVVATLATVLCPRRHDLIAAYNMRYVLLFSTFDDREFGRVCRAVMRSVQAARTLG